jgi:MSHA pilin protein MshC
MRAKYAMAKRATRGFTLTELVVVIIIATVLAAVAIARIDTKAFDTEGYANRAIAMVRYAQKIAISQRRPVAVVITAGNPGTIKLCYTDLACSGGNVREPPGTNVFQHSSPNGVAVGGTLAPGFRFDSLGKPYDSAGAELTTPMTITVTGDITRTITVQPETGFVH